MEEVHSQSRVNLCTKTSPPEEELYVFVDYARTLPQRALDVGMLQDEDDDVADEFFVVLTHPRHIRQLHLIANTIADKFRGQSG